MTSPPSQSGRIGSFRLSRSGAVIAADEPAARIAGVPSPAELLGAAPAPPLDAARDAAWEAGAEPSPSSFERTWTAPSGEERCARILLLPVRGAGGSVDHFDGVIEELDPRHRQAPVPSVGFVESLLDGLPNPVFVKDEQHRWVLLNAAFCAFMGRDRAELLGRSDFDFFPPEEARVFWGKDDVVFANGGIDENEERFTDAAGRTHVIVTRKTLVHSQGRRYLLGVITDITALREANEELRASRDDLEERVRRRTAELSAANALLRDHDAQRAAFLNVLGHELRNPISAISTSSSLLERLPPGSPGLTRARAVIARQVKHLRRLCNDLLDVARVARGKLVLERRVVDLAEVVEHLCEDLQPAFEERGVVLALEPCRERAWVDADETRLAQSFGNLLHNALKFTAPGGRVDVGVRRGRDGWEVAVQDNGVGIPPEELARIFEPFFQAPDGQSGGHGGLGIGLPIAKGLVEAHGGNLIARSEGRGRGVEILATLPAAGPPPSPAPREPGAPPERERRIVVVEDEPDVRESLADLLRADGYHVDVAADGRSGVELVRAVRPDVVLCDLGLPDEDGCEVARRLRADPDRGIAAARLVAVSGFSRVEDVDRALAAGFDAHISKPPSLARLEALLSEPSRARR